MRLVLITGDHPRHLYFVNYLNKHFKIAGLIIQKREKLVPDQPDGLQRIDRQNFLRHFRNRYLSEKKYFGLPKVPNIKIIKKDSHNLSDKNTLKFINQISPKVVFIFGTNMIEDPLFSALPKYTINLHLGLSPWYKGDATIFWPFYFMEPGHAGSTFHLITQKADAGDIIHQVLPKLSKDDHIHDVACKIVIESAKEAVKLLKYFKKNGQLPTVRQNHTGKNFLNKDFKPEHLRVIYNIFHDDIVRQYLEGKLKCRKLNLITLKDD